MSEPTETQEATLEATLEVAPEATAEVDYQGVVLRFLKALQSLQMVGTFLHHIRINPQWKAGFVAELENVPEEVLPAAARQNLQIVEDAAEPEMRLITGQDLERFFLEEYFGPREKGGTGLIPDMLRWFQEQAAAGAPVPVQIDITFLRHRYLNEVADRLDRNRIQIASAVPNLADLRRR